MGRKSRKQRERGPIRESFRIEVAHARDVLPSEIGNEDTLGPTYIRIILRVCRKHGLDPGVLGVAYGGINAVTSVAQAAILVQRRHDGGA